MSTLDDILAKAKPVERIVPVCVAGDLAGQAEALERKISERTVTGRLVGTDETAKDMQTELELVYEAMAEATFDFKFRAVSPKRFSDLLAEHPDPEGNLLFDNNKFPAALIAACLIDPEGMDDPEKAEQLLSSLSPAQQSELFEAAWDVNNTAPKGRTSYAG